MAIVEIRSYTSSYRDTTLDVFCWLGISINLHYEYVNWCCSGAGMEPLERNHRHRYFTSRTPLRSPR